MGHSFGRGRLQTGECRVARPSCPQCGCVRPACRPRPQRLRHRRSPRHVSHQSGLSGFKDSTRQPFCYRTNHHSSLKPTVSKVNLSFKTEERKDTNVTTSSPPNSEVEE